MTRNFQRVAGGVHWLARTCLGILFGYAGGTKMMDPASFAESIKEFELVGPLWTETLTWGLPTLELVAGLVLAIGIKKLWRGAAIMLAGLLSLFSIGVVLAWGRGITVSCGCFGENDYISSNPGWWLTRNVTLMIILIVLIVTPNDKRIEMPNKK